MSMFPSFAVIKSKVLKWSARAGDQDTDDEACYLLSQGQQR